MRTARTLLVALLCCVVWTGLYADGPSFITTPQEKVFVDLYYKENKPIAAAEAAQAYLARHPDSYMAWTVLGWIRLREEADLPRAYYDFKKSRTILEKRYTGRWGPGTPWRAYASTLLGFAATAQQMERYHEVVSCMRTFNEVFHSARPANAAWSLMKLGQGEQALKLINQALAGKDVVQQEIALNTLGAFEGESDEPRTAYQTFGLLYDLMKRQPDGYVVTYTCNLAETAESLLRFGEAERLFLEATKHFDPGSEDNPWQDLAGLYLEERRLPEAIDAVKKMQKWAYHSMPAIGLDNWNTRETLTASLLYLCGQTDEALRLARRVAFRPDRHGNQSARRGQYEANSLLFYRQVLRDHVARLEEEISWSGLPALPGLYLRMLEDRADIWYAGRRAGRIIMSHRKWLADTLRIIGPKTVVDYPGGEVSVPEVVGPGVAEAECRRLLARKGDKADRERPFVTLLLGVCQLESGHPREALKNLRGARKTLPGEMEVTRDEALALEARACGDIGDVRGRASAIATLINRDPGTIRRFGLSLPAVITAGGGPAARKAASLLKDSPRLSPGKSGYGISVAQSPDGALQGTVPSPDGSVLCRLRVNPSKDPSDTARAFCRLFHQKAFAPKMDLSQEEINSIEGSTLASQDARKALKSLLGESPTTKDAPPNP